MRRFSYDLEKIVGDQSLASSPVARKWKVLVVDDVPMMRKMLIKVLTSRCSTIVEAENGLASVNEVKKAMGQGKPFDLILMDYQMPVMDGPSASKIIRGLGFSGHLVAVTANSVPKDVQTFISSGANYVFTKPLDMSVFGSKLDGMSDDHLRVCFRISPVTASPPFPHCLRHCLEMQSDCLVLSLLTILLFVTQKCSNDRLMLPRWLVTIP